MYTHVYVAVFNFSLYRGFSAAQSVDLWPEKFEVGVRMPLKTEIFEP